MFVVDDVLSKLKSFFFQQRKSRRTNCLNGEFLHFRRGDDLFLSSSMNSDRDHKHSDVVESWKLLRSRRWILFKVTCEGRIYYQYQLE